MEAVKQPVTEDGQVLEDEEEDMIVLQYASEELKGDREVVLAAVNQIGDALQYASEELQSDKEVVIAAINQSINSFRYVNDSLKNDPDVCSYR